MKIVISLEISKEKVKDAKLVKKIVLMSSKKDLKIAENVLKSVF